MKPVTVNFSAIPARDIEDKPLTLNVAKPLGNTLYMNGQNVEQCELGRRIYFTEGPVELTAQESEQLLAFLPAIAVPYLWREAITAALQPGE